ncbi:MAG: hypothetical protein IMX00_04740 [Limnochordales bacterium]|nr:hypothetical protein [Limnochordales bacterium]
MEKRKNLTYRLMPTVWLLLFLALVLGASAVTVSAEERSFAVDVKSVSGQPVPVAIPLGDVRDQLDKDFFVNWDTLRVIDAAGKEIPFQIDDVDLNGELSRADEIAFIASGPVTIKVTDDEWADVPQYPAAFTVESGQDGEFRILSQDGGMAAEVTRFGTVNVTRFAGVEQTYIKDLGLVRFAGFPQSRYWSGGSLGPHEERTTLEEPLRIVQGRVLKPGPARVAVVQQYASDLFPGLRVGVVIAIYATGDIRVRTTASIKAYTDFTKLGTIVNAVMADAKDARHVLVPFRWLDFAEEEGKTSVEYYREKGAVVEVDGKPYIAFADTRGPQPPFWGASYIFASVEKWRTNYSASQGMGVAEIIVNPPALPEGLADKIKGLGWQLESEWRTIYFRWVAQEIVQRRLDNGIKVELEPDMEKGNWALHAEPGDTFVWDQWYTIYKAQDLENAIRWLEKRSVELGPVAVTPVS